MDSTQRPDKYHTTKCSIKKIIKTNETKKILFNAITKTNKIVIHLYQFLRLWILYKYNEGNGIPEITKDTIKLAFKSITKDSSGPKPKGENLRQYNNFLQFYEKKYKMLGYTEKLDSINLSQIIQYLSVDILTNIENNIKINFISYVKRFVNSSYKEEHDKLIKLSTDKKETVKILREELFQVKEDLLNNTLNSLEKYHMWINLHKISIFPKKYNKTYIFDIKYNPQNYLSGMIYMCKILEKNKCKSFQFFPLRSNIIPKFIPIDTKSLVELLVTHNKNEYLLNIHKYKDELWSKFFNINGSAFSEKNYTFDYRILTDGFSMSIQLLHNSLIESEKLKKINMKTNKDKMKIECQNKSQEEQETYKKKIKDNKNNEKIKKHLQRIEEIKNLSVEEKEKLTMKKYKEFPYLEELKETELNELRTANKVYVDPGKRSLLYMQNEKGVTLNYTNKKYMRNTKRKKYGHLIKNYKKKQNISDIEKEFIGTNSQSCNIKIFETYIKIKNKLNIKLLEKYTDEVFRKYKWYSHINKKKTESQLINEIKDTFGKDVKLIYGDWSIGKQMRNFISTPNLGLKRKLGTKFTIYSIDEYNTSKLSYKTEEKSDNLYLPDKKGIKRKMHAILTYKMENNCLGCINRDNNAVKNFIKLTNYYLEHKKWPKKYKRSNPIKYCNSGDKLATVKKPVRNTVMP